MMLYDLIIEFLFRAIGILLDFQNVAVKVSFMLFSDEDNN